MFESEQKAYPKFFSLPAVGLKEGAEADGGAEPRLEKKKNPLFFYLSSSLVCVCEPELCGLNEWRRRGTQHCSVDVKLHLNYFCNWLSDPVDGRRVSALKGRLSKCLNVFSFVQTRVFLFHTHCKHSQSPPVDGLLFFLSFSLSFLCF